MFVCTKCQNTQIQWTGKCQKCWEWSTLEEREDDKKGKVVAWVTKVRWTSKTLLNFWNSDKSIDWGLVEKRHPFWSNELNTVLWWGLVAWSLILLSGEPGIGKSTLTLQMTDWFSNAWNKSVYVSCEENANQVFSRANRMGIKNANVSFLHEDNLENILETFENSDAEFAIIDSISMIYSASVNGTSWWVSQIKYIVEEFMRFTKRTGKSIVLIWHVSKDGDIAWPKKLEHVVDVVLYMEGDRYESYRILRALKNRFGATDEIWLFQMTETWFKDLPNPGIEFLTGKNTIGSSIWVTMEGTRAILIELEALSVQSKFGYAKRSSRGIPTPKMDQMIAVLGKYLKESMDEYDCYLNVGHGMSLKDPSIDLSLIASIYSSIKNTSVSKTVFIWEVSLTGIVKNVPQMRKRVEECIKLWFDSIVIPKGSYTGKTNVKIREIEYVSELKTIIAPKDKE